MSVTKGRFAWVDEAEADEPSTPPDDLPADYDGTEKYGWKLDDITITDPRDLNDWTGITVPLDKRTGDVPQAEDLPRPKARSASEAIRQARGTVGVIYGTLYQWSEDADPDDPSVFHTPGGKGHPQKRHGYRMKSGVKSVQDRHGAWKPVKYERGKGKTQYAGTKPAKKPKAPDAPVKSAKGVLAKHGAEHDAIRAELDSLSAEYKAVVDAHLESIGYGPKADLSKAADLQAKKVALKPQLDAAKDKLWALNSKVHDDLKADNPITARLQPITRTGTPKKMADTPQMTRATDFLSKIVDQSATGGADPAPAAIGFKKGVRAFAQKGKMVTDPDGSASTIVHEYGHILEYADKGMLQKSIDFRNQRTAGEKSISLAKATGNSGYKSSEVTKVDKFIHPYMGKDYGSYGSEITSMGIEELYKDPLGLASKDPEYFDFIMGQLQPPTS